METLICPLQGQRLWQHVHLGSVVFGWLRFQLGQCDTGTMSQCRNVLDMLSTVFLLPDYQLQFKLFKHPTAFIQSSWFAREDPGSRSAWRLNAIHRNLMLSAGPQRGQATSPNAKIIKTILKPRLCFISLMSCLCHFVIFYIFLL